MRVMMEKCHPGDKFKEVSSEDIGRIERKLLSTKSGSHTQNDCRTKIEKNEAFGRGALCVAIGPWKNTQVVIKIFWGAGVVTPSKPPSPL